MSESTRANRGGVIVLIFSAVLGFLLADMAGILFKAPSLLKPAHLGGFFSLLGSGVLLYLGVAVYFFGFFALLFILARILSLHFSARALAIATLWFAPLFLVVQEKLQDSMLGMYISLKSPFFYVPTCITFGILVVALVAAYLIFRRIHEVPRFLRLAHAFPGILVTAFAVLLLYMVIASPKINVLSSFSLEDERELRKQHPPLTLVDAPEDAPNMVMLVIEAFRNDEFNAQNAPFLWQLAQENIWFRNYQVVASATRPSVTSFFTSLYPAQHGCYNLALGETEAGGGGHASTKVADTIEAFPRLLQDVGYRTLMVTSNGLTADPVFGFEDVFRRFDATAPYRFRIPSFNAFVGFDFLYWNLRLTRLFKIIFFNPEHSTTYFEAPRVNKTVRREMERHDKRPLPLYAHYMEPHSPYYHHPHLATQINFYAPSQRGKLLSAYRSEIRAVDQAIAELFIYWERNGMLEDTYVFITADHGEEFYDHRNWGHGKSLYPEAISVPAMLLLPPDQRRAQQIATVVENIDVSATILDLAGIPAPETYEGRSLVPLFGEGGEAAETSPEQHASFSQFDDGKVFWASMVTDDGWQVIFKGRDDKRQTLLFDLNNDPLAKQNLFSQGLASQDSLVGLLAGNLARLEASAPLFQGELEEIDPEQLEQLRTLGYVD